MSYLFGNLAFVTADDVRLLLVLAVIVAGVTLIFYRRFLGVCLAPEQAELQGVSLLATDTVLLIIVALTVICLTQVVGLILVIALLSLPAATAGRLVARLATMMWVAMGLSALLTTLPRIVVYGTPVSPEAAIVLAAAGLYLAVVLFTAGRFKARRI
jgi:zinc transport system permease protein